MDDDFGLHESVFKGDLKEVSKLLRTHDVSKKDRHGMSHIYLINCNLNVWHLTLKYRSFFLVNKQWHSVVLIYNKKNNNMSAHILSGRSKKR